MAVKKGRPKNPLSQRSLIEQRKEAERLAKEQEARAKSFAAELSQKEAKQQELEARLAEIEQRAKQEAEQREKEFAARLEAMEREKEELSRYQEKQAEAEEQAEAEDEEPEMSEDEKESLLGILNGALTKEKNPQTAQTAIEQQAEKKTVENDFEGDFEPAIQEDEEPQIIKESATPGKVFAGIPPKQFASILVEGFDMMLKWGAPLSYKQLAFTKEEMQRLRTIQQHAKMKPKKEQVYNDNDYDLFARMDEFLEYQKTVPLSEEEKKSLRIPLEVMLQEKGGDLPPGWALAYAATTIALPRFAPHTAILIAKQFSKFQPPTVNNETANDSDGGDDSPQ